MSQEQTRQNRRESIRRQPRNKTKVVCRKGGLDLGHNLTLEVHNLSQTGVHLILKTELPQGQEVTLTVEGINHPRPVRVLGQVIWCKAVGEQQWQVGIHFQKRLNYRVLLDL